MASLPETVTAYCLVVTFAGFAWSWATTVIVPELAAAPAKLVPPLIAAGCPFNVTDLSGLLGGPEAKARREDRIVATTKRVHEGTSLFTGAGAAGRRGSEAEAS